MRLAQVQRKKAEEILSNFVIMNVILMQASKEGTIFMLNAGFDTGELKKFG
jgi:hypothetical protein